MHVDPMYSAAWNTLLCGRKKWLLIPPLPLTATMEENRAHLAAMGKIRVCAFIHISNPAFSRSPRRLL